MLTHALAAALLAASALGDATGPADVPIEQDPLGGDMPDEAAGPAPAPGPERPEFMKRDPNNPWPNCEAQLEQGSGNDTHSLNDILESGNVDKFNKGMPPRFLELIEMVDQPTMNILDGFNLTGSGYTLIVPIDEAFTFNGTEKMETDLWQLYGVSANLTAEQATAIVRAHIIPGTVGFPELEQRLFGNGTATYTSLEGFEWKVRYAGEDGNQFPVIMDKVNRTLEGYYELDVDKVDAIAANTCPNTVWLVSGFMVGPDDLSPLVQAPLPGAAPGPGGAAPGADPSAGGPNVPPAGTTGTAGPTAPGEEAGAGSGAAAALSLVSAAVGAASFAAVLL